MSDFILFALHEDPILLGLIVVAALTLAFGPVLFLLIGPTRRNHDRRHTKHSELMCSYCRDRRDAVGVSEALRRWPMRILGEYPPEGEG